MSEQSSQSSLFAVGRNCWRVERAAHAAFLIDADAYFKAFVAAARNAQRSILISGWDFHSRTRLLCEREHACALELGDFLNSLAKRRRGLEIHILIWDYPMIFGLDREWAPLYGLGWKPHRRIHFRYDNTQPVGASHHQKIVVIDDTVAFSGGIDLTYRRWDTCEHAPNDVRRVAQSSTYPPFHDLMMAVDGAAARALGELFRERWRRATGDTIAVPRPRDAIWPSEVRADVQNVAVAISRTEPATNGTDGVREVESLYLDMIAAARRSIYIENQYFTAHGIGDALAARLAEEDGPEIIVVLREQSHGWLEELTMQTLRTTLIAKLREADRYQRLRVYYPYIDGLKDGVCIDVHSKMMIVDDELLRIGSANLANRSMGLDTECDLTIEALGRPDLRRAILDCRNKLLGEHLGFSPEAVGSAVQQAGSLRQAIDSLQREDRTLKPLTSLPQVSETVLNVVSVADPEKPVELNDLMKLFDADAGAARRSGPAWGKIAAIAVVLLGLTALWKLTPLAEFLDANRIARWAHEIGNRWWAPAVTILAYTPAAATMFPRPLITLFCVVAFGPWLGFLYAMLGIELSAWLTYVVGRRVKRNSVRRIAGAKLNDIIDVLRRRGLLAITALRLVPLAPFAVEGVVAGAVHVKLWHFMLGTAIGILPGTLASTVFGNQLEAALRDPKEVNYWLIAAVLAVLGVATWLVRRWLVNSAATASSQHGVGSARAA